MRNEPATSPVNKPRGKASPRSGAFLDEHWSLLVVCAVYLATLAAMPRHGLWMVDNENRYLQIEALARDGFGSYAIPWRGHDADPAFAFNPLRFDPEGTFTATRHGQLISVFQPAFLYLGAVALRVGGRLALDLLPIAGAGLMLAGAGALGRRLGLPRGHRHLAVLAAGLATPAWFYSQNLWEHTWAAAACVWGTAWCLDALTNPHGRSLWRGWAVLAAAMFLRDVLGIYALVLAVLVVMRAPDGRLRLAAAAAAVLGIGVALLAAFQGVTTGKPLGIHAETLAGAGGLGEHLAYRPQIAYLYLVAAHPVRALSFAMAAPFLAVLALRPRLSPRLRVIVPVVAAAAAVAGAVFLAGFVAADNPLRHMLGANSFFVAAPVLVLGLLRCRRDPAAAPADRARDLLVTAVCCYLAAYCLLAPRAGAVSLHWGGRMLFCLYPLLAVLAARTFADWLAPPERRAAWTWTALAAAAVVSVAMQAWSLSLVREKKLYGGRLAAAMERLAPEVVITDVWWAGHEMHELFRERAIFYVRTQPELESLADRLHARGVDRFVYAGRPRAATPPPGAVRIDDGWGFYSLDLQVSPLGPAPTGRP